ncbi:hypothetical protein [Sphingomonas sp. NIC1]|uniref:hypothetical protein n=1 Tax=Sphingomonas sp. NIC1 TaxID=1961362 RepID=UPI0018658669|nr:hypothetical protein [Sphingomonas sp. NIC1]
MTDLTREGLVELLARADKAAALGRMTGNHSDKPTNVYRIVEDLALALRARAMEAGRG